MLKLRNKLRALRVRIDMFIMYGRHVLTPGKYLLHRLRCLLLNLLLGLDHMRDLQHKLLTLGVRFHLLGLPSGNLFSSRKCHLRSL